MSFLTVFLASGTTTARHRLGNVFKDLARLQPPPGAKVINLLGNVSDLDDHDSDSDSDEDSVDGWLPDPEYHSSADEWEEDPWSADPEFMPTDTEDIDSDDDSDNDIPAPPSPFPDGSRRPSDIALAERALKGEYLRVFRDTYKCECRCRQPCGRKFSVADSFEVLDDMWGDYPSTNLRRERMFEILRDAWDKRSQCFRFTIRGQEVCELTFRMCLGIGPQTSMWKKLKKLVKAGGDLTERAAPMKQDVYTKKYDRMRRWITTFAEESCDRLPINDKGGLVQFVIPFMTVSEFFSEYTAESDCNTGSAKTFCRAFNNLPHIRTMRCKGSFSTCAICDAASKLLSNVKRERKLSPLEKQVSKHYFITHF